MQIRFTGLIHKEKISAIKWIRAAMEIPSLKEAKEIVDTIGNGFPLVLEILHKTVLVDTYCNGESVEWGIDDIFRYESTDTDLKNLLEKKLGETKETEYELRSRIYALLAIL